MRTIILEGIATSGKSTVIKMLVSSFPNSQIVKVVPEAETLMAIESNTDLETSISYLKYVIEQAYQSPSDVVIFDRLYLTHMFRVHGAIADFAIIEDLLILTSLQLCFSRSMNQLSPRELSWRHNIAILIGGLIYRQR